ncbi:50S ribosomal protein L11 methyltransferase [soil metagenome]
MDYIELNVKISPRQPGSDLMIAELAEAGFESFVETIDGFLAYIPQKDFSQQHISPMENFRKVAVDISFSEKIIPDQNWNAEWEKSYQPIIITEKLSIRAPFHAPNNDVEIDLEIQPQQSFGTGHHPTTRLMAEKLLTMPLSGRYILDMGCGTGVLAILAAKLGAKRVLGIDIETNSVLNACENVTRNLVENVDIEEGTETKIANRKFELIVANINKNVLISAMPVYAEALNPESDLLISGFFKTDIDELRNAGEKSGLKFKSEKNEGEWALVHFKK